MRGLAFSSIEKSDFPFTMLQSARWEFSLNKNWYFFNHNLSAREWILSFFFFFLTNLLIIHNHKGIGIGYFFFHHQHISMTILKKLSLSAFISLKSTHFFWSLSHISSLGCAANGFRQSGTVLALRRKFTEPGPTEFGKCELYDFLEKKKGLLMNNGRTLAWT